jgi:hypothetical protein
MDQDDIDRFGSQRISEIAEPLINEFADRLELDLHADHNLALVLLADLSGRLFEAGYHFGATETAASILQQMPPELRATIEVALRELPPRGPLGDLD